MDDGLVSDVQNPTSSSVPIADTVCFRVSRAGAAAHRSSLHKMYISAWNHAGTESTLLCV